MMNKSVVLIEVTHPQLHTLTNLGNHGQFAIISHLRHVAARLLLPAVELDLELFVVGTADIRQVKFATRNDVVRIVVFYLEMYLAVKVENVPFSATYHGNRGLSRHIVDLRHLADKRCGCARSGTLPSSSFRLGFLQAQSETFAAPLGRVFFFPAIARSKGMDY